MINSKIVLLDGDELRKIISHFSIKFSNDDRIKVSMFYSKLCKYLSDQNMVVICCTISMNRQCQNWNRQNIKNYYEVFIDSSKKTRLKRDLHKQIYKGSNVVDNDIAAEFPEKPDLKLINEENTMLSNLVDEIYNNLF